MHTYVQRTGDWLVDGALLATGYSGHEQGKNAPDLQDIPSVGPIPRGEWTILGPPYDSPEHGPFVLRLEPKAGTETFHRSGFLIHGDMADPALRRTASLGCIILSRETREAIWLSGDRNLTVVEFNTFTPQVC